ncbi:amino acid adenylation domain-containing protein [bacterium]|nr:amino acid adenylation domain-containing protein [bacterium]
MNSQLKMYPLTHAQKRIWYAEKKYSDSNLWNIIFTHDFLGAVDVDLMRRAIMTCIRSNDGLRLQFNEANGNVQQYVSEVEPECIEIFEFENEVEKDLFLNNLSAKPFHVMDSNLYYFCIYKVKFHIGFYMKLHHIICDAWTVRLICEQIWGNYQQFVTGEYHTESYPSYIDYLTSEAKYLHSPVMEKNRCYWLDLLRNMPASLKLSRLTVKKGTIDSQRLNFYLSEDMTDAIRDFCAEQTMQPFHFLFSAFLCCLSKCSLQKEFVLGTVVHNRTGRKEKKTVGMFVNTVPFRASLNDLNSFIDLVQSVTKNIKSHLRHQKYPFDLLLTDLKDTYGYSTDWMEVVFSYDTFTHPLPNQWHANDKEIVPLVLHVTERESKTKLKFEFDFHTAVYSEKEVSRIFEFIKNIISEVIKTPQIQLSEIEMISKEEKTCLLSHFNHETRPLDDFQPIHQLISKQVRLNPDQRAIVTHDQEITFRELDQRANWIANSIRQKGIGPGDCVGCLFDRSVELIVTLLGIMKSGAAYVPIDPSYPSARILHMIKASSMTCLVTDAGHRNAIGSRVEIIEYPSDPQSQILAYFQAHEPDPHDLLYVVFTSGSTGEPKGVMVEHLGFFNLLKVHQETFCTASSDRMTQVASPGFDAMAFEIWPCLSRGATLYIVPDIIRTDPYYLKSWMIDHKITFTYQPTAIAEFLIHEEWPDKTYLRCLTTAGERLKKYPKSELPFRFFNLYGPTEDSVWTSIAEIKTDNKQSERYPSIGNPIMNHQIYITDHELHLQPIGISGELCISGTGLARGYINRSELTDERFISNPFEPGARLYRTGDLAYRTWDGSIQFIGRKDNQVQIRGFRVELGEIEHHLQNMPGVRDAAVLADTDKRKQSRLLAYLVGDNALTEQHIRQYLHHHLPDYMIPAFIRLLDELPRNEHGKLNVQALPAPDNRQKSRHIAAPENNIQRHLVSAFKKYLDVPEISILDHYFELGGDSIKAIQISYEMQKLGYEMHVADLYEHPTIESISRKIVHLKKTIHKKHKYQEIPLTPIQCWFFQQNLKDQHQWNQTLTLRSIRRLHPEMVQIVMIDLIRHHQTLQYIYYQDHNKWIQELSKEGHQLFDYFFEDLRYTDAYVDHMQVHVHELQRSMNIKTGPLVKLGHFRTSDGDLLVFIIHHLAVDGISWRILLEDFIEGYEHEIQGLYDQYRLQTLPFADWSHHLTDYAKNPLLFKELSYWQGIGSAHSAVLSKDQIVGSRLAKDMLTKKIILSESDTGQLLKEVHRAFHTNVEDILLACLGLSLYKWQGIEQIRLHLEGHGRHPTFTELTVSRTIGWFTSIYPVLLSVKEPDNIAYHIKSTKETLRQVPNHGMGYGILNYLTPSDLKRNWQIVKIPEICFNYLGELDASLKDNSLDLSLVLFELFTSPESEKRYALEVNSMVRNGQLEIWFEYHNQEFREKNIQYLTDIFYDNLIRMICFCLDKHETEWTPSDFGDATLSIDDLDTINQMIDCIE